MPIAKRGCLSDLSYCAFKNWQLFYFRTNQSWKSFRIPKVSEENFTCGNVVYINNHKSLLNTIEFQFFDCLPFRIIYIFFAFHFQLELLRINFAYLSSTMFLDQPCHRWVTIECSSTDNQGLDRYYFGITACSSLAKKTRSNHPTNQILSWNHHD